MASPTPTILVTGAAGFIGKNVVTCLLERGWRVRAMARNPAAARFQQHPGLELVRADMRDAGSVRAAVQGVTAVVHLVAAKSDEKNSEDVNVEGARRLVEACRLCGCSRIINISTQSAKIARKGVYARTKNEADRVFHASGLAVTSLLPSVVYGEEVAGVFGTVLKFIQKLPVVPVLGDGKWLSAPVYVGDLSEAIMGCLERDNTAGKLYDLGGPDQISFDALIDKLSAALGIQRPKFHIPFRASLFAAKIIAGLLPNPPITVSNVLGSNQNTNIDIGPARRDFGFNPIGLDEGIRRVLPARQDALAGEAALLTRYLLDCHPSPELAARYAAACRKLLPDRTSSEWRFVCRHPWALPLVDAAAALLQPDSLVRQKVFVMTTILEASPEHAGFFLKKPSPPVQLVAGLIWQGTRAAFKIVAGIPILLLARRSS